MVNSNSLATVRDFPLNRKIRRILPVVEIYAVDDTLFICTTKTDEPIECVYCPEEPNITLHELREVLVASGIFNESKADQFVDCFKDLWLNLIEEEREASLYSANSGYVDKICFARAKSIKSLNSKKVLND
jgi:hypothetical protein